MGLCFTTFFGVFGEILGGESNAKERKDVLAVKTVNTGMVRPSLHVGASIPMLFRANTLRSFTWCRGA